MLTRRALLSAAAGASALLALDACASPSAAPAATGGSTGGSDTDDPNAVLAAAAATAFATSGLAGCSMRVRRDGSFWRGTFGVSDLSTQEAFRSDDFVRIASITKTFTATAILRIVDDGLLALDDTLSTFFPSIPNAGEITIEQMLGMRSGVFDFTAEDAFDAAFEADPTMPWSIAETVEVINRNEPLFAPGARVQYCDSNYALLGAIAEKIDSAPLDEVIQKRVIEPAGLLNTYYPTDDSVKTPHPQGYVPTLRADGTFDSRGIPRVVNDVNPAVPAGAGAIISTLADVCTWGDVLVDGSLLSATSQARRLQTHRFVGQKLNFGYGLGITNFNKYLGHDGAIFGYSSVVFTRPDTKTQIAIVGNESTNSTTPTLSIAVAIINAIDPGQGTGAAR